MKQKLHCLLLIIGLASTANIAQAQTEIDINGNGRPYSTIFDSLSTGLIPSRIPYGTLYDRTYEWSGLSDWKNADTTSSSHLFQSWNDAEDEKGILKKQYKYSGVTSTTINMSGLINGVYTIETFDGTSWNSVKVIKQ